LDSSRAEMRQLGALRVFIMTWVFLNGLVATGLVGPVRLRVETEYGLTHGQFGAAFAAAQIGFSAAVLFGVAPFLRRVAGMPLLAAALALNAAGLAVVCATRSVTGFFIGWSAIFAGTMISGLTNNVSMNLWPHHRRRGVILLHGFNSLGKLAGPLMVAALAAVSWRAGYAGAVFINLALLAFMVTACRGASAASMRETAASAPPFSWGVFRDPFYWLATLPFGMIAGGEAAFATLAPTFFVKMRGLTDAQASLLLALHLSGLALGRFVAAGLGGRVSNRAIIGVCLASGVAIAPAIASPSPLTYIPAVFVLGFMFSATWPAFYAQVSQFFAHCADMLAYGTALGNAVGLSLCIAVSSWIADYNLTLAMVSGPGVLWLFGLLFWGTRLSQRAESLGLPASAVCPATPAPHVAPISDESVLP